MDQKPGRPGLAFENSQPPWSPFFLLPQVLLNTGSTAGVRFRQNKGHKGLRDRKSTRLNSSHVKISYAVFCLKKKNRCPSSCRIPASPATTDRTASAAAPP